MDGAPPPGLDFMRSNQSAILGPHVRGLFSLEILHFENTNYIKKKYVQRVKPCRPKGYLTVWCGDSRQAVNSRDALLESWLRIYLF